MATRTGYTGGSKAFGDGKFSTGITMAANEYPTKIQFSLSYPSSAYYYDTYLAAGDSVNFVLCDRTNTKRILLFTITFDGNYKVTPNSANIANAQAFKGEELFISPESSSTVLAKTGLANSCQVTVTTNADPYNVGTYPGTGGSLSASATSVYPGNTVTVTATPNSGYTVSEIASNDVTLSGSGNTRTFVMPYKNVSVWANFSLIHTLVWSSSKSLSFSQSDDKVTVTLNGSATDNYGYSITYKLYKSGTYVATLSGGKATVTLSSGELGTTLTYKVTAEAGGLSADGPSGTFKAVTHTLGWSNASLTGSQTGKQVTMTFGGSATDSWGKSVSYYLYKENTYVGTFSGRSMTITLNTNELGVSKQYKVVAAAGGLTSTGKTIAYTCPAPSLSWNSGASIYGREVEENLVTVGVTNTAKINSGYTGTVYYRVYIDNVRQNSDGDTRREWTLEPPSLGAAHTYKIDAYAVIDGITYSSSAFTKSITVEEKSRTVKYYDGTQWLLTVMQHYDGADFVEVEPYYYDGTEWILCSMT